MLWSVVSNAALRSSNINREIQPRSDDKSKSFVTLMRAADPKRFFGGVGVSDYNFTNNNSRLPPPNK